MTRSDETVMTCPFDYSELRAYRACACVSLESDFSETIEVIITNLGAATDMRMNHVLIILTLTFVQVHTELNHEKNKMFDYFRNYSSNARHVCREDRPTKGLCDQCRTDDLGLHTRSQLRLKLHYFLTCNISDNI